MLPEEGELLEALGGVAEEFGLLGDHGNMVGRSILNGEGKEALEAMGAVTYKSDIISQSNACVLSGKFLLKKSCCPESFRFF